MIDTPTLIIMRGLPSSGKTTLASLLFELGWAAKSCPSSHMYEADMPAIMCAADDYFIDRPFDPTLLGAAHESCRKNVKAAMESGVPLIIVHNTNTMWSEFKEYYDMAQHEEYRCFVVSLFDGGLTDEELAARNAHGVPVRTMQKYRRRFQHDWAHFRRSSMRSTNGE